MRSRDCNTAFHRWAVENFHRSHAESRAQFLARTYLELGAPCLALPGGARDAEEGGVGNREGSSDRLSVPVAMRPRSSTRVILPLPRCLAPAIPCVLCAAVNLQIRARRFRSPLILQRFLFAVMTLAVAAWR